MFVRSPSSFPIFAAYIYIFMRFVSELKKLLGYKAKCFEGRKKPQGNPVAFLEKHLWEESVSPLHANSSDLEINVNLLDMNTPFQQGICHEKKER